MTISKIHRKLSILEWLHQFDECMYACDDIIKMENITILDRPNGGVHQITMYQIVQMLPFEALTTI